jgi:hypothetical protein
MVELGLAVCSCADRLELARAAAVARDRLHGFTGHGRDPTQSQRRRKPGVLPTSVLALLASGLMTKQIGQRLGILAEDGRPASSRVSSTGARQLTAKRSS